MEGKQKYKLSYCESHYYSNYNGGYYGGLTICTQEFDDYAKLQEYINRFSWEWEKNPNWNGKTHIIEVR